MPTVRDDDAKAVASFANHPQARRSGASVTAPFATPRTACGDSARRPLGTMPKLPQLSLPWAIVASVAFAVLGALVFAGKVSGRELALFVTGVAIPAFRSANVSQDRTLPPPLPVLFMLAIPMLLGFSLTMMACAGSTVAKVEYGGQLKACDDTSISKAEDDACKAKVRAAWDEAGAPAAAILDGGAQ